MNGIRERFLEYLNYFGYESKRQVERRLGLSNGAIDKLGEGTRASTIDKIEDMFPGLNINWLKTGKGEMLKKNDKSQYNTSGNIAAGEGNQVGNVNIHSPGKQQPSTVNEISLLKKEIEYLKSTLADKEKIILEKERLIQVLMKNLKD